MHLIYLKFYLGNPFYGQPAVLNTDEQIKTVTVESLNCEGRRVKVIIYIHPCMYRTAAVAKYKNILGRYAVVDWKPVYSTLCLTVGTVNIIIIMLFLFLSCVKKFPSTLLLQVYTTHV